MMIYDYLRLPANVIALLINHVAREAERKSTPEHPVSVNFRDIKSEAVRWYEHGITTVAEAERYIKDWEHRRSSAGRVMRMLALRDARQVRQSGVILIFSLIWIRLWS